MKIIQVIDNLGIGGAAKVQVIFAREAARHNLNLLQASFGDGNNEPLAAEFDRLALPVFYFPALSLFDPGRIIKFTRFLRHQQPDIIQTHLTYQNIIGCFAGWLARIPVVCTLHSTRIKDEYYDSVRFWLEIFCLRNLAYKVIAVGESVRQAYLPFMGKKEIVVVSNPVNIGNVGSESELQKLRQGLVPDGYRVAIAVGRLAAPKAYPDMIQAFKKVFEQFPETILLIVGGGELQAETQEIIDEQQLNDHVKILGEREDVPELLAISHIFVSSSHWEGLPISILEAMSTGLPIVATRVGDIPQVVQAGTGILVEPGHMEELAKAVIQLVADPEAARRMGEAGRVLVSKNHSPEVWMDRLLEIFQQTIREYSI